MVTSIMLVYSYNAADSVYSAVSRRRLFAEYTVLTDPATRARLCEFQASQRITLISMKSVVADLTRTLHYPFMSSVSFVRLMNSSVAELKAEYPQYKGKTPIADMMNIMYNTRGREVIQSLLIERVQRCVDNNIAVVIDAVDKKMYSDICAAFNIVPLVARVDTYPSGVSNCDIKLISRKRL